MTATPATGTARLDLVDALRGSALLGILLLHSVEHWNFMRMPVGRPAWLEQLDNQTVGWAYWLLGGKAYAIFALMFGVSFFITLDSWRRKGDPNASTRFVWRMALLGALGYVHGLLYNGDILGPIALLGVPLVLLERLGSRALVAAAVLLLLQLPQWAEVLHVWADPAWQPGVPRHWGMFGRAEEVAATGTLADLLRLNGWQGQLTNWWWLWESWRWSQMLGLFACGLLLGRSGVLHDAPRLRRLAWRALVAGLAGYALVWLAQRGVATLGLQGRRAQVVADLPTMYGNLAQMAVWAGGFTLLYPHARRVLGACAAEGVARAGASCGARQGAGEAWVGTRNEPATRHGPANRPGPPGWAWLGRMRRCSSLRARARGLLAPCLRPSQAQRGPRPLPRRLLGLLVPYGRMSLTCYVSQAVIGVPFFYGFGLGMYRHVGPFAALFFGLAVFAVQCALAHAWLKRYSYGPLEWLWRAATMCTWQVPMRRRRLQCS